MEGGTAREPVLAGCMTVRGQNELIADWLRWHLHPDGARFTHAYIVFDNPDEMDPSLVPTHLAPFTTLLSRDMIPLRNLQSFRTLAAFYTQETMARQCLHAEYCAALFRLLCEKKYPRRSGYLLHLDCDELFLPQHPLPSLPTVIHFKNYEMAHLDMGEPSPFRSVTTFKTGQGRPHVAALGFRAYINGKSAIQVHPNKRPLKTDGVHNWVGQAVNSARSLILHYVCHSFAAWARKYELLGNFSNLWFGQASISVSAHLSSRDSDRSPEAYARLFIVDPSDVDAGRSSGDIFETTRVCSLLARQ